MEDGTKGNLNDIRDEYLENGPGETLTDVGRVCMDEDLG